MGDAYRVNGELIRDLRNQHGMTAEELSRTLDVTENYLYSIERSERLPSLKLLIGLSVTFGLPLPIFFHSDGPSKGQGKLIVGLSEFDVPPELIETFIKLIVTYNRNR